MYKFAVERCEELISAGQDQQAIAAVRILTEIEPGSCEAWYHLGEVCRCVGYLQKAESALTRAQSLLRKDSDEGSVEEADIDFELGRTYLQMGEYEKAAFFFSRVIPHRPCSFLLHMQLYSCFFRAGAWKDLEAEEERYLGEDTEELVECLAFWLDDHPLSANAYAQLGRLMYRRGLTGLAMSYFEKAFYVRVQDELNNAVRDYLQTHGLRYDELIGLSRFQEDINRRFDYPQISQSDIELMRREAHQFCQDRLQLTLDFNE